MEKIDIDSSFLLYNYIFYSDGNTASSLLVKTLDCAKLILRINNLMMRIEKENIIDKKSVKKYKDLFNYTNIKIQVDDEFPNHVLSPYVDCFINLLNDYEKEYKILKIQPLYSQLTAQDINENQNEEERILFLKRLKTEMSDKAFKNRLENKKKYFSKNKMSLLRYINGLFKNNSRLLVLRLDTHYIKSENLYNNIYFKNFKNFKKVTLFLEEKLKNKEIKDIESLSKEIDISNYQYVKNCIKNNFKEEHAEELEKLLMEDIQDQYKEELHRVVKDRENFIKKIKKKYKDSLKGYVWKLEFAKSTGFHLHFLFFLDGAKHQQDANINKQLGEIWVNEVTNGEGRYWNCNDKKYKSHFDKNGILGIGMIGRKDKDKIKQLENVAKYLIKIDYIIQTVLPLKTRTFGKGQLSNAQRAKAEESKKI